MKPDLHQGFDNGGELILSFSIDTLKQILIQENHNILCSLTYLHCTL